MRGAPDKRKAIAIEPAAIWSNNLVVFDTEVSLTQNVILSRGRQALLALIRRIDDLYALLASHPQLIDFYPSPVIPQVLTEICAHHGVASSILFNDAQRHKDESARAYALRKERVEYVARHLALPVGGGLLLSDRTLRNKMIHMDESVEKAMRSPSTGWLIDSALAYRDQFEAPEGLKIGYCRTFIASEQVLLHLGHEIFIPRLRDEATTVLAAVFRVPSTEAPPKPKVSKP